VPVLGLAAVLAPRVQGCPEVKHGGQWLKPELPNPVCASMVVMALLRALQQCPVGVQAATIRLCLTTRFRAAWTSTSTLAAILSTLAAWSSRKVLL